jgi:hypothetical protein
MYHLLYSQKSVLSRFPSAPNQSFNPDAASTGNSLLHSFGFLVSSQRAAVGTAG